MEYQRNVFVVANIAERFKQAKPDPDQVKSFKRLLNHILFYLSFNRTQHCLVENLQKLKSEQSSLVKSIKRLKSNVEYARKSRALKKIKLENLQSIHSEENLVKNKPGPWPIEAIFLDLFRTIIL